MVCQSAPPASSPAPRLRARSMLSLGTEVFFAFWMASYNVGLPAGSPPPVRAATSMFLISLAKFLPRRSSMIAFLCLVVAHLEWPLMQVLPLSLQPVYDDEVRSTSLRGPVLRVSPLEDQPEVTAPIRADLMREQFLRLAPHFTK